MMTKQFIDLISTSGNDIIYHPDAKFHRYKKLVYNATFNTTCALVGLDTGRLELAGTLDTVTIPAMREVLKIAKADGVELPADSINSVVHSDDSDWFKPSMLIDVEKGNPIELEAIS
ncbi:unnamed protein product [Ambrosiozyma monospora]|uniref:Unnamed protein product n=1 Tax=Ambrosiozyma monospora TaxID=43982 RepID=A0A9W6Z7A5_AMBMO|nr:unnamed protein product [Ambrosiozyma monospora]